MFLLSFLFNEVLFYIELKMTIHLDEIYTESLEMCVIIALQFCECELNIVSAQYFMD